MQECLNSCWFISLFSFLFVWFEKYVDLHSCVHQNFSSPIIKLMFNTKFLDIFCVNPEASSSHRWLNMQVSRQRITSIMLKQCCRLSTLLRRQVWVKYPTVNCSVTSGPQVATFLHSCKSATATLFNTDYSLNIMLARRKGNNKL